MTDDDFADLARSAAYPLGPDDTLPSLNLQLCRGLTLRGVFEALDAAALTGGVERLNVLGVRVSDALDAELEGDLRDAVTPGGWVDALWSLEYWSRETGLQACKRGDPPCDALCGTGESNNCLVC